MAAQQSFKAMRDQFIKMPVQEKRKYYSNYTTIDDVPTWERYFSQNKSRIYKALKPLYPVNTIINTKVSLWTGDIADLEVDVIVNPTNLDLSQGGAVHSSIHSRAGSWLQQECSTFGSCRKGEAQISGGYKLPAKYVIHTVGPPKEDKTILTSCYNRCLRTAESHNLSTIAFPCISTGEANYSNVKAARTALKTAREWLENDSTKDQIERIIFCVHAPRDIEIYEKKMQSYFPVGKDFEDYDVDTRMAGNGSVSVTVQCKANKLPVCVTPVSSGRYQVEFVPQKSSHAHIITVLYNGSLVPGFPFACQVSVPELAVTCKATRLLEVGKTVSFEVKANNMPNAISLLMPEVNVTDAMGRIIFVRKSQKSDRHVIRFTPDLEGPYDVSITLDGKHLSGSPFICLAQNSSTQLNQSPREQANTSMVAPVSKPPIRAKPMAPVNPVIGKRLGKGAFGTVYLCYDPDIGRELAVKRIPMDKTRESKEIMAKVRSEVELLSSLHHERIVQFFGCYEDRKMLLIYMEYMPGGSVADQLEKYGPLTEKVTASYTSQILEGLEYIHGLKIIHRDIKGENILRDPSGTVKLADFGCSKAHQVGAENTCGVGTYYWMSPDILRKSNYDAKTDIWSLGCTVVEMINGIPPWFQFKSPLEVVREILRCDHPSYKLSDKATNDLRDFLNLCFKKTPGDRPPAAQLRNHRFCTVTGKIAS